MRIAVVVAVALYVAGCGPRVVRTADPISAESQLRLSQLPRVWIAGFATDKKPEFDLSSETVRLLRTQLRTWSSAQVIQADPIVIDSEQRLSDVPYWRRLGEEYGRPLIITGSVRLLVAPAQLVQRGVRTIYLPSSGRVLEATVVVIDGNNGKVLSSRQLPRRMRYGIGRFSSALALYFQMMDQSMPDWFEAITATAASNRDSDHS